MNEIAAIVAIGPNEAIGIGDKLIWHSKQDFYHFKKQTHGYPCIFGDKTFFGLPKYPLKNRLNVVVSLDFEDKPEIIPCSKFNCNFEPVKHEKTGSYIKYNKIENAIDACMNFDKIFICGGASIYKYCIQNNLINTLYLTKIISPTLQDEINENKDRYVYFPISLQEELKNSWERVPFEYQKGELPEENSNLVVQFQKWVKK